MSHPTGQDAAVGVVVIDKPPGMTSHDVVQRVRRVLHQRRVGHAGTLDPMATGVLVVMVGAATKLAQFLSADAKSYRATIQLGTATTTADAEGEIIERAALPGWLADPAARAARLASALDAERHRTEQTPPVFSAIKVEGRAAHARTRAGEELDLPPRPVQVHRLELASAPDAAAAPVLDDGDATGDAGRVDLDLTVSKGYYVRALARDLGRQLGLPAHLTALRRTASGAFELSHAVQLADLSSRWGAARLSLEQAARIALPHAVLTDEGARRAGCGQLVRDTDFAEPSPAAGPTAWFDRRGSLIAVGQPRPDGSGAVIRGFAQAVDR